MKKCNFQGYTLVELSLTLTLTSILLICFFHIQGTTTHNSSKKNYLSYFLPLEFLLKKADAVSWDGITLSIRYLCKDSNLSQNKESNFRRKIQYIKIISKRETNEPCALKILLPEVYSVDWSYWDNQNHRWRTLKYSQVYPQKIFRVVLFDKDHYILEQFIF